MKINPRMAELFRATTEVLLMTTVVALAAVAADRSSNMSLTPLENRSEHTSIAGPGRGQVAKITLKDTDAFVEVGGQPLHFDAFLRNSEPAGSVVLRLNGPQWRELTKLIRTRDLQFTVETDP
jgi:hypothetical protein